MEKKLSNIVKWYDSYLEYLSIVGKQLTKIEKNHSVKPELPKV